LTSARVDPEPSSRALAIEAEPRLGRDLPPLIVLASLLALACCGHFVKPHADFYEFRETGRALLDGEAPPTFKRAPLFPVLLAVTGSVTGALFSTETPPDQLAAGWINAVLLPANVILSYLIGRRWFGPGARWAALWVALLPVGLYCTAHALVEPLLVSTVLLTVHLAQRGSKWAYFAGALASLTRYDAAGVLVGVTIADLLRRQRLRGVATRAAMAFLPLAIWLAATAATWETRSQDHYLRQIGESRYFDIRWPLASTLRSVFGAESLSVPVWTAEWEPGMREGVRYAIISAALFGSGVLLWRRERGALAAVGLFVGYVLVHAVFPFRFFRFGYPPAPLVILAAAAGTHVVATHVSAHVRSRPVRGLLLAVVAVPLVVLVCGEASRLRALLALPRQWVDSLPLFALAGVALTWLTAWRSRERVAGRIVTGLALCALTLVQMRLALTLLGDGRERINVVKAACWVRDHTTPDDGVLTDDAGILRLYAPDRPPERFVGLGGIEAEDWPAILDECRRRGIRYIIWHHQVIAEQGGYYIHKWRLRRFEILSRPEVVPGVAIEMHYVDRPTLWILRVLPE
jgi:hypothetical protein